MASSLASSPQPGNDRLACATAALKKSHARALTERCPAPTLRPCPRALVENRRTRQRNQPQTERKLLQDSNVTSNGAFLTTISHAHTSATTSSSLCYSRQQRICMPKHLTLPSSPAGGSGRDVRSAKRSKLLLSRGSSGWDACDVETL